MPSPLESEVDRNFEAFCGLLSALVGSHRGEWVLMRDGRVAGFFSNEHMALAAGRTTYDDGLYSVQEVTDRPVDLGFFSHAVNPRLA